LGSAGSAGSGGSAAGSAGSGGAGGSAGNAGSGGAAGSAEVDAGQPHVYTVTCSLPGADAGASDGSTDGGSGDANDEAVGTTGPAIASFTLYDYETNLPFSGCKEFLKDFTVAITGDNVPLTVVANVAPGAGQGRVVWDYDGMLSFNTERRSPFALGGDAVENDLDPPSAPLAPGTHTVTITLYAEADPPADAGDGGLGTVLGRATIKITIVKQ
jgi:hypothetical protein